jgi:hypothetical protein
MDDERQPPGDGFELWDLDSAFLIDDWDTLEEALVFVRGAIEGLSEDEATAFVSSWGLDEIVNGEWTKRVADGVELLKLAREQKP